MKKFFILQFLSVLIFIIIIIVFGFDTYNNAEKKIFSEFQKKQLLLSKETAIAINNFFEDLKEDLALAATKFNTIPATKVEFRKKIDSILTLRSKKPALLFIEDKNGILRFIHPEILINAIGKNFSFREYFKECKENLRPSISNYIISGGEKYQGVENKYPTLVVAVPLFSKTNQFNGVLGADIYLHTIIKNFIAPLYLEKDNKIFLVDNENRIIASDDYKFLGSNIKDLFIFKKNTTMNKEEGSFLYHFNNSHLLFSASYVRFNVGSNKWSIIISSPYKYIQTIVFPIYIRISLLASLAIMFLFLISYYLYSDLQKLQALKLAAISKELEIGYKIQKDALPKKIPKIEGYDIFAINLPAKKVSGDFYDFVKIKHLLHVAIADVCGKGIPAALYMMMSKVLLNLEMQKSLDVASVLENFNSKLLKLTNTENNNLLMYLTAIYGILDPKSDIFIYARAGHPSPLLFKNQKNQVIELPEVNGSILGAFENFEIEVSSSKLETDDILILYTDGLSEATNLKKEIFDLERINTFLLNNKNLPLAELGKKLISELTIFTNNNQDDDITLILIKNIKKGLKVV